MSGFAPPYGVATTDPWTIDQSFAAGRDATTQSFITTSSILKTADYPQFTSSAPWDTGVAGAYEPHTGDFYMYSQRADIRYQRLMNTFTVDDGTDLSFFVSYDTEPNWDFVFVELQGEDEVWVTLPEANGHTTDSTGDPAPRVGTSCTLGSSSTRAPTAARTPMETESATGTQRPVVRTAGRSGSSTCRRTQAKR